MSKAMNNNENVNYSSNFNQAVFNGNLPSAPRLTSFYTRKGTKVYITYFRVLSDDYYNGYQTTTNMNCIAFGQHAINIAKNFHKGDFVEAKSTISTYPTKKIQGVSFKYPVTITRFSVYSLDNLNKPKSQQNNGQAKRNAKGRKTDGKKNASRGSQKPANKRGKKIDISDDELPF